MITIEFIAGLAVMVALVGFAMWCCYRAGSENEYERGRADAYAEIGRQQQQERAEKTGPSHAKSQPRESSSPAPSAVKPKPSRTALVRSGYRDSWRAMYPKPGLSGHHPAGIIMAHAPGARPAVTAESIATVLLPPAPAPALTGAADTGTMPKVKLPDSDTVAMQAIYDHGDTMVRAIERGELV
jgi:hypothetical protein